MDKTPKDLRSKPEAEGQQDQGLPRVSRRAKLGWEFCEDRDYFLWMFLPVSRMVPGHLVGLRNDVRIVMNSYRMLGFSLAGSISHFQVTFLRGNVTNRQLSER